MRPIVKMFFIIAAAVVVAAGFSGCSDSMISSRDDQHVPSVPPPSWGGNPLGMPTPNQHTY